MDRFSKLSHMMFNIALHHSWGVLMAIMQPDLRDSTQFLEVPFFWFEHIVLLVIPCWAIWTGRFFLNPLSIKLATASFFIIAIYHSLLLTTVALVTGVNLNYVLKPPLGVLELFGIYYRPIMYLFCFFITLFTRYVLWAGVYKLIQSAKSFSAVDGKIE